MREKGIDEYDHRYMYGIDLASKKNYTGIVVHDLPVSTEQNDYNPIPKMVGIYKLPHRPYNEYLNFLADNLYTKMPPYHQSVDYTNEKTFTDMLVRDFGVDQVEGIIFNTTSKKMLKDDGLSMLKQGYTFPNLDRLDPLTKKLVIETVEQLQHEKLTLSPSGQETFPKPPGRDNDLAVAWELSIHSCIKFTLNMNSETVVESADYTDDDDNNNTPDEFDENDPFPELSGSSRYNIKNMQVRYSNN